MEYICTFAKLDFCNSSVGLSHFPQDVFNTQVVIGLDISFKVVDCLDILLYIPFW